jgi:hypothetical protein
VGNVGEAGAADGVVLVPGVLDAAFCDGDIEAKSIAPELLLMAAAVCGDVGVIPIAGPPALVDARAGVRASSLNAEPLESSDPAEAQPSTPESESAIQHEILVRIHLSYG